MGWYYDTFVKPFLGRDDEEQEQTSPEWGETFPEEAKRTYETWTGQQMADWWSAQGGQGNWYDPYASTLNPEGTENFDWSVYNTSPVAQVYKNAEGAYNVEKVYPEAYNLYRLRTENPQDWWQQQGYNYQDIGQSEPYQGMTGLLNMWQNPEYQNFLGEQGGEYAAKNLGFESSGAYRDTLSNLQQRLDSIDYSGQMSEDQRIALANDVQQTRQESMMMLEAMRASGRTAASLYKADEISGQIGDMYIQGRLKFMEANLARAQVETSALMGRYESLAQQGLAGAEQYLQQAQNYAGMALQGYATQLSSLVQQNSQYIDLYSQHAQQVYNSIMADMGFDEHAMNMAQESYEQYMAPFLDDFQMQLAEYEMWLAEQEANPPSLFF